MEIIFGIDPGSQITGYGVVRREARELKLVDFGCIRPPKNEPISLRYKIIFEGLGALLDKFMPTAVAVETQYVSLNPRSTMMLSMARGMAILAATLREIPVFEYAPSRAKKAITGTGRASKEQVQKMIQRHLGLAAIPTPEDAADALALALCHMHTSSQGRCKRV